MLFNMLFMRFFSTGLRTIQGYLDRGGIRLFCGLRKIQGYLDRGGMRLALRISRLFARPRRSWAPAILVVEAWLGRKQTRMQGYHQEGHLLSELQISSASSSE